MDSVAFFFLVFLLPPGLLMYICLNGLTTGRIAAMLRGKAVEGGEVQRCLNSVFSERVTWRLGERRWLYATGVGSCDPDARGASDRSCPDRVGNRNQLERRDHSKGHVEPLEVVSVGSMTTFSAEQSSLRGSMLVVYLVNLVLAVVLWSLVVRQLRPAGPMKPAAG